MTDNPILRAAPEPIAKPLTREEAIAAAQTAFVAARRAQLDLMAGGLNQMLFTNGIVNRRRLQRLRDEAREQVQRAMQVEQLIDGAVRALEATRAIGATQ